MYMFYLNMYWYSWHIYWYIWLVYWYVWYPYWYIGMIFYTYDYCINLIFLIQDDVWVPSPSTAWIYFITFFSTGVYKIDFGTNGVDIRDNEVIIPPFCTEFRPGLNGTSHGSKIQNYPKKKNWTFLLLSKRF